MKFFYWLEEKNYLPVLAVLLLVVAFKLPTGSSLWLDECLTYWTIQGSLDQVLLKSHLYQAQSSLYFLICKWFYELPLPISAPELKLRIPSLVFGILGAIVFWKVAQSRLERTHLAIAAIALLTLNAIQVALVSARPYSLAILFFLLSLLALSRFIERGGLLRLFALSLTLCFTWYSHYLFTLSAAALVWIAMRETKSIKQFFSVLGAFFVATLMFLPGLQSMLLIASRGSELSIRSGVSVARIINFILPIEIALLMVVTLIFILIYKGIKFEAAANDKGRALTELIAWLMALVMAALMLLLLDANIFLPRYFIWYSIPVAILTARIFSMLRPIDSRAVAVVVFSVLILAREVDRSWEPEDWRGAVNYLQTSEEPRPQKLLMYSGMVELDKGSMLTRKESRGYLTAPILPYAPEIEAIPIPAAVNDPKHSEYLKQVIAEVSAAEGAKLWLISYDKEVQQDGKTAYVVDLQKSLLEKLGYRQLDQKFFGAVVLNSYSSS